MVPKGITSTGWPAVEATCRTKLGVTFDDWQQQVGRLILAKRADGNLASMIDGVGLSVCRQVGKTYTVGSLIFALCVNIPGLLVIWSAHHSRTHGETFLAMQAFAQRAQVEPHIKFVHTGSNTEEIAFHNGSRILFGARERGFGRGIPGVDVLIFDEAQILSDRALSNMLATLNTSRFGLQLYIGTPPKPEDMSEAFTRMRTQALDGELTDGAWIELGADDDADENDRKQWAKANPSFPKRTPVQSMLRLKRKLTPDDWKREGLGIWPALEASSGAFDVVGWDETNLADVVPEPGMPVVFAVDMSWDRKTVHVAVALFLEDQRPYVREIARSSPRDFAVMFAALCDRWSPLAVGLQGGAGSPASSLNADLQRANGVPRWLTGAEVAAACGRLKDSLEARSFAHPTDPDTRMAVSSAVTRTITDGWVIDRKKSPGDVAGLVAIAEALWLLSDTFAAADYAVSDSIH